MASEMSDAAVEVIAKAFAEAWDEHPANTRVDAQTAVDALRAAGFGLVCKMTSDEIEVL